MASHLAVSRGDDLAIELVRTPERFVSLEGEWDALYREASPTNPFLSYAWTRACWETQGETLEPFVIALRSGDRLVGLAPLAIQRRNGLRVLRFIAEGRSDYLGFLRAPGSMDVEQELVRALALTGEHWDLAVLRQLAAPLTNVHELAAPAVLRLHKIQSTTSAYCNWDGDWDSLHEVGPSWLREMRKRRRRFLRDGGSAMCFTGSAARERLHLVAQIEARSWKERKGISRLQPGPGQQLLRRAFESMPEAQVWIAFVEDEAAAFQVGFVTPERLLLYQASYDERFSKSRAGSVLAYFAIEEAWKRGVREYDYLAGDEPYKLERTSALRPICQLVAHRRTAKGWLAYASLIAPRRYVRNSRSLRYLYNAQRRVRQSVRRLISPTR